MPGQNHAVRIKKYTTIFLKIVSDLSTVLWMPFNEK